MDGASKEPLRKDYYKVLEVDYDASDDTIKLSYRRLALMWHPDKHKGNSNATTKFQEINEAYKVLSDPAKRLEYDVSGCYEIDQYTLRVRFSCSGPTFEGTETPLINGYGFTTLYSDEPLN
ncbi:Chaperone protein DnaJ [Zea mays]|uniref:Chaperone protein DnaJ n=1 Tax=Zea mays TaxID=4577 RepID=A0A3L6EQ65_MAIZE|nr:Chaperone protein DnaJ [Zea mays]